MFKIIKNFNWIILWSILCIFFGILTFLTFINVGFIPLTNNNLLLLLTSDAVLLFVFFYVIFKNIIKLYSSAKNNKTGSETNIRYISLFSLFTIVPSLIVSIFSLFIFNYGVQQYFDDQIKKAVNNSYDVAKNYLNESKENVKSDVILMSVGLNRSSEFFYSNMNKFKGIMRSEKILRRIDDIYLIDSTGSVIISDTIESKEDFVIPTEEDFNLALNGTPVFVSNNLENKTTAIIKLNTLIDTYLYISRNIEPKTLKYLNETEQAVSFYYSIENKQTGIKITFAVIYIIIVTLLLFLSIVLAISFATRLTKPIINLISASNNISKGLLDTKVPEIDSDKEFMMLNQNFNNMIERLKKQQDKLLISERYEAWETVARKLAHEIKNPLTPIQLSIDRLREKYSKTISEKSPDFENYLQTINRQIKDIENLVNEFSNFARMPRPILKKINIFDCISRSVNFFKISSKSVIALKSISKKMFINGDEDQLNRVFINLIKNSEESIYEKNIKNPGFKGKIDIEINEDNDYIIVNLIDNGTGVSDTKKIMTPYFTTKKKGTGLGLPIVSKIINEHSGELLITNNINDGIDIKITFPKIHE
jgi:two-component system nitrogen regulation sensor histidine kinase NtrY